MRIFKVVNGARVQLTDTEVAALPPNPMHYMENGDMILHTDAEIAAWQAASDAALPLSTAEDIASKLSKALKVAIEAGVTVGALTYPTDQVSQHNLNGVITQTLLPNAAGPFLFWCADAAGKWARRPHTLAEIQAVGQAVLDHVKAQQDNYELKLAELDAAVQSGVVADIKKVKW